MQNNLKELSRSKEPADRRKSLEMLDVFLAAHPDDANAWYEKACCHDFLGEEKESEPCYRRCLDLNWQELPEREQKSLFVGFGSTLRNNLQYEESVAVLLKGLAFFPNYAPLQLFLALSYHSQKEDRLAAEMLFKCSLNAARNGLDGFERAAKWYIENLDTHPETRK